MKGMTRLTVGYLAEYARRPVNVALLVLVPLVFVMLASGSITDFASIVGGIEDPGQLAAPTAGWAAAFLAGVAGFFHVLGSRDTDRRLANAGMGAWKVTFARLVSGLGLALLASAAAIIALALRTGLDDPVRTIVGTVMTAVIYLGIGIAIGAVIRNEINGSLIVIFIWMLDVFLGPAMAGGTVALSRVFPSHFVTLYILNTPSSYAGPLGDLGWVLVWTVGALTLAALIFGAATATRRKVTKAPTPRRAARGRLKAGLRYGLRDNRRNVALWVLLVVLPVFFISLSFYITPDDPAPVELIIRGITQIKVLSMINVHGAIMVPITIAFLAGLTGMFVVQGSLEADARLALAGFRPREILASRLGVIALAGVLTTVVSLAVTAIDFVPQSWLWFAVGNGLVAATYGMVGVVIGALFGRVGGLYLMFLIPFVDVGIAQNIMFSAAPPGWGSVLPARGAVQVLIDGAFTPTFDRMGALLLAVGWLVVLTAVGAEIVRRIAEPKRA
ncbi:hypothetical protein BMS3Bbin02_01079 [bacterium BMS3Bbin02]|nr:hypothetical protein BMS3Bbin02_01079 [bacterium BMS3Bbin02]